MAQREDIVGYIGIWTSFETADLCNMAVAHEFRRCKVGNQLLKKGLDEARKYGVKQMLLEVRESNVPHNIYFLFYKVLLKSLSFSTVLKTPLLLWRVQKKYPLLPLDVLSFCLP